MSSGGKQVQVELYIGGHGPCHSFKAPLLGWDENRLDLDAIMASYRLKSLYAFSPANGRGNRLLPNPRNGLSQIAYSGKPDVLIRLDGDLADSYIFLLVKFVVGIILIGGLVFFLLSDSLPESLLQIRDSRGGHGAILACFITMLYTQLVWRPARNKRYMMNGRNHQKKALVQDPSPDSAEESRKEK